MTEIRLPDSRTTRRDLIRRSAMLAGLAPLAGCGKLFGMIYGEGTHVTGSSASWHVTTALAYGAMYEAASEVLKRMPGLTIGEDSSDEMSAAMEWREDPGLADYATRKAGFSLRMEARLDDSGRARLLLVGRYFRGVQTGAFMETSTVPVDSEGRQRFQVLVRNIARTLRPWIIDSGPIEVY